MTQETAASQPEFPVESFREAARHLRRPFTPEAVRFKVQSTWQTGGLIVGYIDARLVIERLNLVCPHLWCDHYENVGGKLMWCHLTIDGITRSDVGEGTGKALVSDALKRAAVRFGIGVSLYAMPSQKLPFGAMLEKKTKGEKENVYLTDRGEDELRNRYRTWLDVHARAAFGDPLDHGDSPGASGDHEAETLSPEPPDSVNLDTGEVIDDSAPLDVDPVISPPEILDDQTSEHQAADTEIALTEAAKGLKFREIKLALAAVGLPAPQYAKDSFALVPPGKVDDLLRALGEIQEVRAS